MSRLHVCRQFASFGLIIALAVSVVGLVAPGANASNSRGQHFNVLGQGAHGHRVHRVQTILHVRPFTGHYNNSTRRAVRHFQHRRHLAATGVVNAQTWHALGERWHAIERKVERKRSRVQQTRERIMRVVRAQAGAPYVFGAAGPRAFDCSGLVLYVYRKATNINYLPHLATGEYRRSHHISRRQARPGDLVVFHSGRNIYHAAIYAGHGFIWEAPHSGSHVKRDRIWSHNVWFGRLLPNV
jgi:cell wall-associated NlpC family hydrolase